MTAKPTQVWRVEPATAALILRTLETKEPVQLTVPTGYGAFKFQQSLGRFFTRKHPKLRLYTRILPNGLLAWVTKRAA